MNKKTLLTIISLLLVAASVFGLVAGSMGDSELSDIVRYKKAQKADIIDFVDILEERVEDLREAQEAAEDDEKDKEDDAEDGEEPDTAQTSQSQQQYNAGASQVAAGQASYSAAEQRYNETLSQYQATETRIRDVEIRLTDLRASRSTVQAQLDATQANYNKAKPVYDLIQSLGLSEIGNTVSATLAQYGYTSMEDLKADIQAYEAAQTQLAEIDRQISAAEQQLQNDKTSLAGLQVQLDQRKAEMNSAQASINSGNASIENAKNEMAAEQERLNENVDKMNELKDSLKEQQDDVEAAVKSGVDILMENEGIAALVEDESDYEGVLEAAREYVDTEADKLNAELDVRQGLYNALRILSAVSALAGIICLVAAYRPNIQKLTAALAAACLAAVGAVAVNIYGLANDYTAFAYTLEDGSGDGSLQLAALIALLVVSILTAVIALLSFRERSGKLPRRAKPAPTAAAYTPAPKAKETLDVDDYEPPVVQMTKKSKPAAPEVVIAPESIDDLEAETRRLNEEAERLEAETRKTEYEKARQEYEEARRRFEEARRKSEKE